MSSKPKENTLLDFWQRPAPNASALIPMNPPPIQGKEIYADILRALPDVGREELDQSARTKITRPIPKFTDQDLKLLENAFTELMPYIPSMMDRYEGGWDPARDSKYGGVPSFRLMRIMRHVPEILEKFRAHFKAMMEHRNEEHDGFYVLREAFDKRLITAVRQSDLKTVQSLLHTPSHETEALGVNLKDPIDLESYRDFKRELALITSDSRRGSAVTQFEQSYGRIPKRDRIDQQRRKLKKEADYYLSLSSRLAVMTKELFDVLQTNEGHKRVPAIPAQDKKHTGKVIFLYAQKG